MCCSVLAATAGAAEAAGASRDARGPGAPDTGAPEANGHDLEAERVPAMDSASILDTGTEADEGADEGDAFEAQQPAARPEAASTLSPRSDSVTSLTREDVTGDGDRSAAAAAAAGARASPPALYRAWHELPLPCLPCMAGCCDSAAVLLPATKGVRSTDGAVHCRRCSCGRGGGGSNGGAGESRVQHHAAPSLPRPAEGGPAEDLLGRPAQPAALPRLRLSGVELCPRRGQLLQVRARLCG